MNFMKNDYQVSGAAGVNEINAAIIRESRLNGFCIDENLTVVKAFGDTSAYLKHENFSGNLDALMPENILLMFKAAVFKVLLGKQKIVLAGINLTASEECFTDIIFAPVFKQADEIQLVLVLFSDTINKKKQRKTSPIGADKLIKDYISELEKQLTEVKQDVLASNERWESLNENLHSFNRELISGGKEMQSANQELHSVNEQLQSINKDHESVNIQLQELNDDLNNYFRSNLNGQLFVNSNLLLKKYSPAATKHINVRESDIGRPLSDLTTNIKFETLVNDIKRVIDRDETITREAESSDGKVYQVMTMPYLRQNSEHADGAVISFYDITELKNISVELDASNKTLIETVHALEEANEKVSLSYEKEKELSKLKSRFVSMASHEFRTPLSTIQLSAVLIEKYAQQFDQANITKHTGKIAASVNSLIEILNDLLSLEKLEAGIVKPSYNTFDMVKLSESIAEEMQLLAKENQQIIYQHTGKKSLVTLNYQLLKNCIVNLINNAIKYSGENTFIEFNTEINAKELQVIIKDNGIGIPEEDQKYLFEPFFRAHNTGKISGTGLGLNMVTRYTKLMNGDIKFKSILNRGTLFTITFPM